MSRTLYDRIGIDTVYNLRLRFDTYFLKRFLKLLNGYPGSLLMTGGQDPNLLSVEDTALPMTRALATVECKNRLKAFLKKKKR